MGGKWIVSPISPHGKGGVAVANYQIRTESEDRAVDCTPSIAKASGLTIRVENSRQSGDGVKSSCVTRYRHAGIHAPTVQR
jgi:hypothetical protein